MFHVHVSRVEINSVKTISFFILAAMPDIIALLK